MRVRSIIPVPIPLEKLDGMGRVNPQTTSPYLRERRRTMRRRPRVGTMHELAELQDQANVVTFVKEDQLASASEVVLFAEPAVAATLGDRMPENSIVASIQSPGEWCDPDTSVIYPQLTEMVANTSGARWTVAFPRVDVDPDVHRSARKLGQRLTMLLGDAKRVRLVRGDGAYVDLIAGLPDSLHQNFVSGVVAQGVERLGRPPVARESRTTEEREPISAAVDEGEGVIALRSYSSETSTVLLEASAARTATYEVWNDFTDPARERLTKRHNLRVGVADRDGQVRFSDVLNVSDEHLGQPRKWLARVPRGAGDAVSPNAAVSRVGEHIAAAIRAHEPDEVEQRLMLLRNGYFHDDSTDRWGFVTPAGLLTAHGVNEHIRSRVSRQHEAFQLADTRGLSATDKQKAATAAMGALETLGRWGTASALIGITAYGLGALSGHGRGTGCVLAIVGSPGSGKSVTLRQFFYSFLAPQARKTGPTLRGHDRAAIHRNAYRGMDSSPVVADDFKNLQYDPREDSEFRRFDALARPGYEGGAGGSAKSVKDEADGSWDSDVADPSSPIMMIGTERLPTGALQDVHSALERLFPVTITRETAFASGTAAEWNDATAGDLPHKHMSAFVSWVCAHLDELGLDGWRKPWLEQELLERRRMRDVHPQVTDRGAEVATVPLIGVMVWTRYLVELGVMDEEEREQLIDATRKAVTSVAVEHAARVGGTLPEHERVLDAVSAGVASGALHIGSLAELRGGQRRVGIYRAVGGEKCVLLFPGVVADWLAKNAGFPGLSQEAFVKTMKPIVHSSTPGQITRKFSVDGKPTNAVVLLEREWLRDAEPDPEEDIPF